MTKIYVLISLFIYSITYGQIILQEGFEKGIPSDWEIIKSKSDKNWKVTESDWFAPLRSKVATIEAGNLTGDQDEWLITPSFDLSNAKSPALEFIIAANDQFLVIKNLSNLITYISTDNGENWTPIWRDDVDFLTIPFPSFKLQKHRVDLTPFIGEKNVKIAFQYYTKKANEESTMVYIDDVLVVGEQDKYCIVYYPENAVFPITRVQFSNIDHQSPEESDGKNYLENFTHIIGEVDKGKTYSINVEIDEVSSEDRPNYVTAYIDWNSNGFYGGVEVFPLEKKDDKTFIGSITIPSFAKTGLTRLRIIRNSSPTTSCFNTENSGGQTEDYSILIKGEPVDPIDDGCTIDYPGSYESGSNFSSQQSANDFNVEANRSFEINKIVFAVGNELNVTDFHFYKDNNGMPGELIQSIQNVSPSLQVYQEIDIYEMKIYKNTYTLPSTITLKGGSERTTYWLGINSKNDAIKNLWFSANQLTNNSKAMVKEKYNKWEPVQENIDGAFTIFGECKTLNTNELNSKKLTFYPNPVSNHLNIKAVKDIREVSIYNLAGQLVRSEKLVNHQLNTSYLSSGTYIIKINYSDHSSESFKIIKK